ncbi:minor tail protein [Mycobacterium phage Jolene]|uniref:Minor tail protein n=3 Tax=Liefievirus TaxID=1623288 RepID=G1JXZ5_9CAUD|nr:minor tail protein [Mycobacterium phage Angel]YP_008129776.1 minor tail protein [Mycobacterium phage Leo]YP_009013750.1 minor tail protein [Mycobacterium phage Liefie]ACB58180.1 hypothetical protein BPs1_21 [Mycobacterium phage BPs]ACU41485.1 hypothetical protein HOPE_21 [Mycobacterium phage Hope]AER48476.1 hypothetical protein AVRAFAN_21 [Mycobacterium phage Avrafan]AGK85866.1 hypothetical protein Chy2_0020 [Mycobacterium phage Chy2]AGK85926.1 hypothetical protein Chy3_0022 [Mycobacteriu
MTTPTPKKPFEKRYKTVVPVKRPAGVEPLTELGAVDEHPDYTMARWLGRESFENTAADDRLDLVEYAERLVPLDEVDPRLADMLGAPVEEFEWFEFSGLGRLDQDAFDYFSAEILWRHEQWLAAERAYLTARDAELLADNAGGA